MLHGHTGHVGKIARRSKNRTLRSIILEYWPNDPVMLTIGEMLNTDNADLTGVLAMPEKQTVKATSNYSDQQRTVDDEVFQANARGSQQKKRARDVEAAAKTVEVWQASTAAGKLLRDRKINLDLSNFSSEASGGHGHGKKLPRGVSVLDHVVTVDTLVVLPNVPAFLTGSIVEALIDHPLLIDILGFCCLHMDMRVMELITDVLEGAGRAKLRADAKWATPIDDTLNDALDRLKTRHKCQRRGEQGEVPDSQHNGKDARIIRNDILLCTGQDLNACRRRGGYKSIYIQGVFAMLVKVDPNSVMLTKLPEYVGACLHACEALRLSRILRPDENVYDAFDHHASLFMTAWRLLQEPLKGYGFHLGTTARTFFRTFKSLEAINQSGIEGSNERFGRVMPQICKGPVGRYSNEDLAKGPEHVQAILEDRRRRLKSICRALYEWAQQETVSKSTSTPPLPPSPCLLLLAPLPPPPQAHPPLPPPLPPPHLID